MRIASLIGAAMIFVSPLAAHAATVTFDALPGSNADAFTSYSEAGFTVTKTAGDLFVGKSFGNPVPNLFGGPLYGSASSTLDITAGGLTFNFGSFDFSSQNGATASYLVTGFLNNVSIFSLANTQPTGGGFQTINSGTGLLFDRLSFVLNTDGTSFNFDNFSGEIGGSAVPEPATWLSMVIGFAGLGMALRAARRRGVFAPA